MVTVHLDHLPGSFFGPSNLVDLLLHRSEHQPRDVAFVFLRDGEVDEVSINYGELDRQSRAIAAWLQSAGMTGERALLLYPAGLEFIAAYFGCLYAGVVAVPAYPPRRNRKMSRIQSIVDDSQAKVALATADVTDRLQEMIEEEPGLANLTWTSTDRIDLNLAQSWRRPDVHGDTLAFLQYTSGSTGTPKGVMLTHANLLHNSAMIAYVCEHTRSGMGVFWLPSYHDMGLIGGILQPMYVGRPNILFSPLAFLQKPFRWLDAISRYRATISGGPNFAYDLCVEKIKPEQRAQLDLSSWQVAFNGAEPVRAETIERFVDAFGPCGFRRETFFPCYGLAESTLLVSGGFKSAPPVVRTFDGESLDRGLVIEALSDETGARDLVGSGGVVLDQKIIIVDPETGTPVAKNHVGEVWVSGPSVAQGYWRRPEETAATFQATLPADGDGPWLRTGDLGFLHEGEVFITGRMKDLIIIRGVNHYPQDIEWTAEQSDSRLRRGACAAFAVEEGGRERLVIVAELERRRTEGPEEVVAAIRSRIAADHDVTVDAVVLLSPGGIPKTSSGKIQRHAARQEFLAGTLQPVHESVAWATPPTANGKPSEPAPISTAARERAPAPSSPGESVPGASKSRVADAVLEHVRRIAKDRAAGMTLESSIPELGLDSLERMEIVASIEEEFGARFPDHILTELVTCQDVIRAVETYLVQCPDPRLSQATEYQVGPETYDFDYFPEIVRLRETSRAFEEVGLKNPYFTVHESVTNDRTVIQGRELVNFSGYNYLGMSGDPQVTRASQEAIARYGTSVSASRLVSGQKPIHHELEQAIAAFLGTEDAITFVGGHATNESTIGHLLGPGDLIVHDALAHNSIVQGAKLSGARRRPFPHNDWRALDEILSTQRQHYRRVLIAIEGVYSMDGDIADLPGFIDVKKRHKAILFVDEAHSLGVLGIHGRGIGEHFGVNPRDVDIWMGTLSKALGSCGGYVAGRRALVDYLKYTAPGFVFSNGISPANTAAALAALQLLEDEPQRVSDLAERSRLFLGLARQHGLNTGLSHRTAVVPVIVGNSHQSLLLSQAMFRRGFNVQPILYPAVEERAARLRFFLTCMHTEPQIRSAVAAVAEEFRRITDSDTCPSASSVAQKLAESNGNAEVFQAAGIVNERHGRIPGGRR